jgi:hypothetical protein
VNTVDVYTIATNTWASAAAYPQAVGGLFAVAANGRIAAGGGTTAARTDTAKTYQYNPATNTWNDATLPDLPAARRYSASDVLHGRWIVAGGRESGGIAPTAWALDLSNPAGGWAALPDLENLYPGPGGAATADAFYIFGGDVNQPRAAERYEENLCATPVGSPSATPCAVGAWDARAPAPAALQGSAAAAQGGRVYLFGGVGDSGLPGASAYVYTAGANTWQALAPLPEPRSYAGVVGDGAYLYIVNGLGPNGAQQNTVWRYDPATNSYTSLAPAPLATAGQAIALLDGRIYRVAGNGPGSNATSTVDVFTIATNSWAPAGSVAPYPVAIAGLSAVGANGAVWAGGGGFPQSAKAYRYDPVANAWNDGAIRDLPAGRASSASGLLGARWLLAGGDLYTESPTSSVVALDLNNPTGLWQNLASLPHARRLAAGATDGASFYVLGGGPPVTADTQRYTEAGCGAPTATPTACPAGQFSDVHASDYFYTPVQYLVSHGVVSGYADCTFRPYNNTTRAQMVKIVTLGFAIPIQTPAGGEYTFADAPPSQPFFAYIETAAAHNVISGYACGGAAEPCDSRSRPYFRPNANVTRGQLSKITVGAAGWSPVNPVRPTFGDVAPGTAFYTFVETAVCHGVISGYADGTFRPAANATRGQIAKIEYLALTSPSSCGAPTTVPATATPTAPPTAPPTDTPAPTATDTPAPTASATPGSGR